MAKPIKPAAIAPGDTLRIISPASPAGQDRLDRGIAELQQLRYRVVLDGRRMKPQEYFSAPFADRLADLTAALCDKRANALVCARGGYGSSALLGDLFAPARKTSGDGAKVRRERRAKLVPKLVIGYSDVTALQTCLWRRLRWVTLYGPMVAAGFDAGAGQPNGYDLASFNNAVSGEKRTWSIGLQGEVLKRGTASGIVLGGCLTLLQTTIGTPWEVDTRGAILVLEDCTIKPYQLDRMLLHMAQAGKFRGVRGIVLGEFPGCDPPSNSGVTVRDVCLRILRPLNIPMVFGAPVGHTPRPMLSVPLGVRGRLHATGEGRLEILETAVVSGKMKSGK